MKFSMRELLLVTVIAALAVGWWVDRGRLAGDYQHKVDQLAHKISAQEIEMENLRMRYPVIKVEKATLKNAPPGMILVPETPTSAPAPNPPVK